jgi:hypothetical protein
LAVCSITHGAILLAVAADAGTPPRVTAREELMAPMAIAMAATKNNEQKTRRHLNGVNMDVGFGFVIIEIAGRIIGCCRTSLLNENTETCQSFSRKFCISARQPHAETQSL